MPTLGYLKDAIAACHFCLLLSALCVQQRWVLSRHWLVAQLTVAFLADAAYTIAPDWHNTDIYAVHYSSPAAIYHIALVLVAIVWAFMLRHKSVFVYS